MPSWLDRGWLPGLILLIGVFFAYQPLWSAGYIWDDDAVLTANPVVVGPLGLKEIWTTTAADICPLTLSTFWLEHALWGLAPLPYHLVNVLLHGTSAVLLWRALLALKVPGAWLGAALWALHPVEVESVAWISEMKNTESSVFYLLTILFFVKGLEIRANTRPGERKWNYAFTLLFAAMAMASKSSTVILPLVLCLCAWWIEGHLKWRHAVTVAPMLLFSLLAGLVSIWTQKPLQAALADPLGVRSWPERLITAGDAVWFYLGKLIWPYPLMTTYPRWQVDASQGVSYLPLLGVMIVVLILWLKRDSWSRPCFFAFAYFALALFPALGLVNNTFFRYSLVADHFQYLASMGPLALAGAGMVRLADVFLSGRSHLQMALGAAVLLLLGIGSWQRARVYLDEETLWTDELKKNPQSWAGYNNLGFALVQKGRVADGIDDYRKALALNSNFSDAHYNLGSALAQDGNFDEAIAHYHRAMEINPRYADAYNALGIALFRKGQVDDAVVEFQKALEINPDYSMAYTNLGNALFAKGRVNEAIADFQKVVELRPGDDQARQNLAKAQAMAGQIPAAK